jgi:hypothetical protein
VFSQNGLAPSTVEVFSLVKNGILVTETGVSDIKPGSAFRMYLEKGGDFSGGAPGSVQSGFALELRL